MGKKPSRKTPQNNKEKAIDAELQAFIDYQNEFNKHLKHLISKQEKLNKTADKNQTSLLDVIKEIESKNETKRI